MLGLAALTVAGLLVVSWVPVISLYESLQPGVFGIIALSIAQLALLPTVVVWAFSWLVGPGFALGVGAVVSPLGTTLQAVPALPLAGILAVDVPAWSLVVVAVPLVVAFAAGLASRTRLLGKHRGGLWRTGHTTSFDEQPLVTIFFTALLAAGVAAGAGAILTSLASGEMGPGRFIEVGPNPAQIALWWGVEVLFGVLLGLLSGGLSGSRADTRR
jgi:hypothetical protein